MLTIKPSDMLEATLNEVNFEHPYKTQVNRSPHEKQVNFDPPHKKQVNFDTTTEIKLIRSPL